MRANRSRDTGPELDVRRALFRRGWRYRKHYVIQTLAGRVQTDVAFPGRRLAVFIDGCFWHGCARHRGIPATNAEFWSKKIRGNVERDARQRGALRAAGWTVLAAWEHDPTADTVLRVEQALRQQSCVAQDGQSR